METPWSSVGYLTYKRTYARALTPEITEEWPQTVDRVLKALNSQLDCEFTEDELDRIKAYHLSLKASVAGRFLWQLGTKTVDRLGLMSLQNCAAVTVNEPIWPFTWVMDSLALGSGVGFNIQKKNVDKLPVVREWFSPPTRMDEGGADFIIPDSREGWVKFLGKTLKAAFLSESQSKGSFTYSTQVIRGKGTPIKGFGGLASGPEDLCWGVNEISKILVKRRGRKIRPIDALDIMNLIGYIIVAGNVRRSAQIAVGDPDDVEFLLAKRWDLGNIPKWRAMSNNSVVCHNVDELHEFFWQGYEGRGEPYGLINLDLARSCGRLGETQYQDPGVQIVNPCGEQFLEPYETCCLSEIFLPNVESKEELLDISELFYRINKHSLALRCHQERTEDVVHKNYRMGIGVTGVMMSTKEQLGWLDDSYTYLRDFDSRYSRINNFPKSIKLTTVKPSGTLSLLPGVTPGIHPGFARFMYRRIRVASENVLVEICRKSGYDMEFVKNFDGTEDTSTTVITFPFRYPDNAVLAKDMSAIDQLEMIRYMQSVWSDNSVSCTVYYRKEEIPEIKNYLRLHFKDSYKSLSFLLHSDHGFPQAPYEEITEEEYNEYNSRVKPIAGLNYLEFDETDPDCSSGACPVR